MNVPVTQDGIHLGPEARIRLPNVDEALDQGYNLHGADDPDLEGTYSQKLAQKLAQEFIELRARPNTPEVPYLMAMQSIARGYGRAITRLKNDWFKEHEKADAERERLMSRLRESRFSKQGIGALWRYLVPILLGIIGFLTAQVVGGKVPTAVV